MDQIDATLAKLRPYERVLLDTYLTSRPRARLLDFTICTFPTYKPDPAHALIAATLDEVLAGNIKRLMIFAPPQHGKSELISVRFPALWLAHRSDDPIILTSYGASLACIKSREARNVVESTEYQHLFPRVRTDPTSRAGDYWKIQTMRPGGNSQWRVRRGSVLAAGVGGPITGHGAALGIIDDPISNWREAQSPTVRESIWQWWRSTFRPRIRESGHIVLVMTRWHEDDLAGRLLEDQAERWTILRLPALAESQDVRDDRNQRLRLETGTPDPLLRSPGEPLCPQLFSREALLETQKDVGSRVWSAEYDGYPTAPEGNRFKRDWFEVISVAPTNGRRVRYWDKAGTSGGGDFTVGVLMSTSDGLYFVEDVIRGQWSALERNRIMKQTAKLDGVNTKIWVEQEPGSSGKESAEATKRDLAGYPVFAERVTGSKEVRAEPFAAQCEASNVKLIRGPWVWMWLEEICSFPLGKNDDQVDGSTGAFRKLVRGQPRKAYHGLV